MLLYCHFFFYKAKASTIEYYNEDFGQAKNSVDRKQTVDSPSYYMSYNSDVECVIYIYGAKIYSTGNIYIEQINYKTPKKSSKRKIKKLHKRKQKCAYKKFQVLSFVNIENGKAHILLSGNCSYVLMLSSNNYVKYIALAKKQGSSTDIYCFYDRLPIDKNDLDFVAINYNNYYGRSPPKYLKLFF